MLLTNSMTINITCIRLILSILLGVVNRKLGTSHALGLLLDDLHFAVTV